MEYSKSKLHCSFSRAMQLLKNEKMKKHVFIILSLLFSSLVVKSQISNTLFTESIKKTSRLPDKLYSYHKCANEARFLYFNKKYSEAISMYKKAFLFWKPQATHLEDLVECFKATNQNDSALKYAQYCIENFGYNIQRMAKDSVVDLFYNQEIFKQSLSKFYTNESKIRNEIMIEHYLHNDRFFRSEFKKFNLADGSCINDKEDFTFKVALQYDSIYAIPYILSLIQKYSFPNAYDIGNKSVGYFLFLLRHYNIEKYVLDSALINGKILPEEYASLVDYKFNVDWETLINEGKLKPKNNFGPNLREIDGRMVVGEIDDIENVDERREAIGLMPLWQFAKYKNFELSDAYKKVLERKKIKYQ
jgi:hypothetical protein